MYEVASRPCGLADATALKPAAEKSAVFLLSEPGLEAMGEQVRARAGDALTFVKSVSCLRVVTEGVVAMIHDEAGLCTAVLSRGHPLAPLAGSGRWLTDGAYVDLPFEVLCANLGPDAALRLWARASVLSRATVETELVCALRHTASRRLARWLLDLLKVGETAVLTQAQLAELSGLQRTSVCAAMASLQTAKALKVTRGRIRLRSHEALEGLACECRPTSDLWLASAGAGRDRGSRRTDVPDAWTRSDGLRSGLLLDEAALTTPAHSEA